MLSPLLFIIWGFLCAVAGWVAARKGREGVAFAVLAFLLSAAVAIPAAVVDMNDVPALRQIEADTNKHPVRPGPPSPWLFVLPSSAICILGFALLPNKNFRRCPDCGERIRVEARICRFCRHDFTQAQSNPAA